MFLSVLYLKGGPRGRAVFKAWGSDRSLAGTAGSNPTGGHGSFSLVSVVCCRVDASVTGWSLVQRSSTDCGASDYDCEASTMRKPWPIWGGGAVGRENHHHHEHQGLDPLIRSVSRVIVALSNVF